MKIFQTDTAAKLQSEVDRLTRKRAALAGRLVSAQSAETAAIEARRRHLVESDDEDLSAGAKFSAAVDAANRDRIAIEDALSELDKLIEEGRAAIVAAREASARQKRAAEIEAKITKLEPMIATAERHFEALADVLTKIIDVADDRDLILKQYSAILGPGAPLPAVTLASAALAEALFRSLPDGFAVTMSPTRTFASASLPLMIRRDGGLSADLPLDDETGAGFRPAPLSGALTANLVDPLRAAASEILAGDRPLATARPIAADDDETDAPIYEHRIAVLVRPIRWRDAAGEIHEHADATADLPEPVILAAKAAGVAFDPGSPEAAQQLELRYQRGVHHPSLKLNKEIVTLDVKWPAPGRLAA